MKPNPVTAPNICGLRGLSEWDVHPPAVVGEMRWAITLPPMNRKLHAVFAATVAFTAFSFGNDLSEHPEFKKKMLKQVGRRITVVGTVNANAKFGAWISFDDWGAYVYPDNTTQKRQPAQQLTDGHSVRLVGTLHHREGNPGENNSLPISGIAEHFYFELADIIVTDLTDKRAAPKPK